MKRIFWLTLFVVFARALLVFVSKNRASPVARQEIMPALVVPTVSEHPSLLLAQEDPPLDFPTRDQYVSEAKLNPHHAPRVLSHFADQMAVEMERALVSETSAENLFERLKRCALDSSDQGLPQARAICTVNAARLSEKYPSRFEKENQTIREALPSDVLKLVHATE